MNTASWIRATAIVLVMSSGLQAQSLKKIRIGSTTPSITTLPTEIALKKGFFKEEGLEPEMITIRSADIIIKALLTGHLDYATSLPSLVAAAVRGFPIRVFGVMIKKTTYVMVSQPSIRSMDDLRGRVVGVSSFGAASDYAVRVALQKGGLDPKRDLTIIQVGGSSSRLAALQGGTIQATVLVAPFNLQAERMGYRTLLWLGKILDLPQGGLGAQLDRAKQDPAELVRMLKAMARGIQLIKSRKEETIKFMMEWLKTERSVAEETYPMILASLADYGIAEDSVIQSAVDAAKFEARINKEISLEQVRDWSFAFQARRELEQKRNAK